MRKASLLRFVSLPLLLAMALAVLQSVGRQTIQAAQVRPLAITTPSLPSAVKNTQYSAIVLANGGLAPYSFAVVSGSLPVGLSLDAGTGAIRGAPSATGSSNFTIQVVDSENPQARATQNLSITVVVG
jgi:hypothetical protein